jgi:hypothetical protein
MSPAVVTAVSRSGGPPTPLHPARGPVPRPHAAPTGRPRHREPRGWRPHAAVRHRPQPARLPSRRRRHQHLCHPQLAARPRQPYGGPARRRGRDPDLGRPARLRRHPLPDLRRRLPRQPRRRPAHGRRRARRPATRHPMAGHRRQGGLVAGRPGRPLPRLRLPLGPTGLARLPPATRRRPRLRPPARRRRHRRCLVSPSDATPALASVSTPDGCQSQPAGGQASPIRTRSGGSAVQATANCWLGLASGPPQSAPR